MVVDRHCNILVDFGNTVPPVVEEVDREDEYPQREHRLGAVLVGREHILSLFHPLVVAARRIGHLVAHAVDTKDDTKVRKKKKK